MAAPSKPRRGSERSKPLSWWQKPLYGLWYGIRLVSYLVWTLLAWIPTGL